MKAESCLNFSLYPGSFETWPFFSNPLKSYLFYDYFLLIYKISVIDSLPIELLIIVFFEAPFIYSIDEFSYNFSDWCLRLNYSFFRSRSSCW